MSLKLGFMPASLYMSNSPIRFFSATAAPPESIVRSSVEA